MTTDTRSDWKWLEGTYWYCAADSMPAIQGQGTPSSGWVIDQTPGKVPGDSQRTAGPNGAGKPSSPERLR
jgi:hypothetical protein